ncbi:hypothetical protein AL346_12680 [Chelatococcus sp. CO-6]|nr:hypothetical protein AL346_12680 [Chelatococcus sp. CO-6]
MLDWEMYYFPIGKLACEMSEDRRTIVPAPGTGECGWGWIRPQAVDRCCGVAPAAEAGTDGRPRHGAGAITAIEVD